MHLFFAFEIFYICSAPQSTVKVLLIQLFLFQTVSSFSVGPVGCGIAKQKRYSTYKKQIEFIWAKLPYFEFISSLYEQNDQFISRLYDYIEFIWLYRVCMIISSLYDYIEFIWLYRVHMIISSLYDYIEYIWLYRVYMIISSLYDYIEFIWLYRVYMIISSLCEQNCRTWSVPRAFSMLWNLVPLSLNAILKLVTHSPCIGAATWPLPWVTTPVRCRGLLKSTWIHSPATPGSKLDVMMWPLTCTAERQNSYCRVTASIVDVILSTMLRQFWFLELAFYVASLNADSAYVTTVDYSWFSVGSDEQLYLLLPDIQAPAELVYSALRSSLTKRGRCLASLLFQTDDAVMAVSGMSPFFSPAKQCASAKTTKLFSNIVCMTT